MLPLRAYEIHTVSCRYTLTIYSTDEGRFLAEYCAHRPVPGPLIRLGDLQPPSSSLAEHREHHLSTLLRNCLGEIERDSGPVTTVTESPLRHSAPGHECNDFSSA